MKKIAILGATGHIGKSLVNEFLNSNNIDHQLFLYVRSKEKLEKFIGELKAKAKLKDIVLGDNYNIIDIENFGDGQYDVVINCLGLSDPSVFRDNPYEVIELTEAFDNKILNFLSKNNSTLYINMSSGAAYGKNSAGLVNDQTLAAIDINNIKGANSYSIAKLYSEAKHRILGHLNIVDLRVFVYFSQFADLNLEFLMSDLAKCLVEGKVFKTNNTDILRDISGPEDLYSVILHLISIGKINDVFDVVTLAPVTKFELIDFLKDKYGLKVEISESESIFPSSATGSKNTYCSSSDKLFKKGFKPKYTSLETVDSELRKLLNV